MRRRKPIDGDIEDIAKAMKKSKNPGHFRRIQCIYLAMLNPLMTAEEIGASTLFTARNVGYIFADYRKHGLKGLEEGRGGRRRENLTLAQEAELLKAFEQESQTGSLVVASKVRKAYEPEFDKLHSKKPFAI